MGGAGIKPWKDTPRGKANPAAQPVATMHARMVSGPAAKDVRAAAKCAAIIVATRPTALPGKPMRPFRPQLPDPFAAAHVQIAVPVVNGWIRGLHKM